MARPHILILLVLLHSTVVVSLSLPRFNWPKDIQCSAITPWGRIDGHETEGGACRFALKYGTAERWSVSRLVSSIGRDAGQLPPSCPQLDTYLGTLPQSEDCLYGLVYVPKGPRPVGGWPVYIWIHGGSFVYGSASQAGLDGSRLAVQGNMIVVVLQYRLGVLGLLPPSLSSSSKDPNLAVQDVILGLQAVKLGAAAFGGDARRVTVGGQSSGGTMIRALLASPQAKGLFRAIIIQSDPMNYGFSNQVTTTALRDTFYSTPSMAHCTDLECLKSIPIAQILASQAGFLVTAPGIVDGVPNSMPLRPTYQTASVPANTVATIMNRQSSLSSQPASVPLLLTTTANEAGTLVQSLLQVPQRLSNATYEYLLTALAGEQRAKKILQSKAYVLPAVGKSGDEFRMAVERVGTDLAWRCASREFARAWSSAGGRVWVAEWHKGVSYLSNVGDGFCHGKVCHEDDIYPSFGTSPKPDDATSALQQDTMDRWSAFIHYLDPNSPIPRREFWRSDDRCRDPYAHVKKADKLKEWRVYKSEADVLALGGSKPVGCPDGFWGKQAKWDWQLYV